MYGQMELLTCKQNDRQGLGKEEETSAAGERERERGIT